MLQTLSPLCELLLRASIRDAVIGSEYFVSRVRGPDHVGSWARSLSASEARTVWPQLQPYLASTDDRVRMEYLLGSVAVNPGRVDDYRPVLSANRLVTLPSGATYVPLWTGYSLGYHLVCVYANRHPGLTLQDLTKRPPTDFAWPL